jgi:hypothetical protein
MTSSRCRSYTRLLRISELAVFVALFTSPALAQTSQGIPGVLAPGVAPELVQGGFAALEGPVSAADGTLYFSDRCPTGPIIWDWTERSASIRRILALPTAWPSHATATW